MADGDKWSTNRTACLYTCDDGSTVLFRALSAYVSQSALGWEANTDPLKKPGPRGLKHRRALCWDAGNHANRRSVVVATNADYIALVPGTTTLTVQNPSTDVEDTFTVYGLEGERLRGVERD